MHSCNANGEYKKNSESRKNATLKAHNILLRLDNRDFHGAITFNFKGGQGLMSYKIEECAPIEKPIY